MADSSRSVRRDYLLRHWAWAAALLLTALMVFLAGNPLFPLIDRDESRFAQASRQMLRSGDWTVPRFLDEVRLKKPILIYWLQASSMRVFGETPFAARLPSVAASFLTLAFLAVTLPRIIGHRRTLWSLFIFATALLPVYIAKVCMTDAVLLLWIVVPMLCLYRLWRGSFHVTTLIVLGLTIGLAMLTKGPSVFLYLGMTLAALWALNTTVETGGAPRTIVMESAMPRVFLCVLLVLGLAAAVCVPWVVKLEARHPGALVSMFTKEIVERGLDGSEGHDGPPGYYFVTFWAAYFPWCLFWPAAIYQGWKRRHLPWVRFSLAAVIGPWAFLEIYQTKLPHYWLPSYPFMAILTADALLRGARGVIVDLRDRPFLIGAGVWAVATTSAGVGVLIVPFFGPWSFGGYLAAIALALGFAALAWGVFALLRARRILHAAAAMGLGSWAIVAFTFSLYWPNTPALTLAERVGRYLHDRQITVPGEVQMIGFKEASTAFYQGGTIREQSDGAYFSHAPEAQWPRWTVIDAGTWAAVPPDRQARLFVHPITFTGANIADGKWREHVLVLEKKLRPTTMSTAAP